VEELGEHGSSLIVQGLKRREKRGRGGEEREGRKERSEGEEREGRKEREEGRGRAHKR
jgi:hypothetical protein